MKIYEVIKIDHLVLSLLQKSCISLADCDYLAMYEEYKKLLAEGSKKTILISYLSKKYSVSERRVWYLIKKFESECKIDAL